ncbi:MAG TPA: RHS repeat-associated core domain-containing protein, partial [Acidimicrobiales bacterium]|nr:RHS repeat-associated core domain-containing protein [Acidimicrobiales bacterium]
QLRWIDGTAVVGDSEPWATVGRDGAVDWLAHDWQGSVGPAADPWGAPVDPSQARLGYRGELEVDGLLWLRNRAYDPSTRSFLSTDPQAATPGHPFAANPYHYAGNDPVGATDPLGLHPMSEADLAAYREAAADNGLFDHVANAWDATTGWVADNWEYIAAGAMIVVGGALLFTGVGTVLGGALLAGGISAGSQRLMNGEVNWGQVGIDMVIGGATAGAGSWASGFSSAAWSTTARVGFHMGVNTTLELGSGMAQRQLTSQDPFDTRGLLTDSVTGLAGGGLDTAGDAWRSAHLTPDVPHVDPTPPIGDGPVTFRAPPDPSADEIAQVQDYIAGSNRALQNGDISPTGRVTTQGELRATASQAARDERIRAAAAGTPYSGHAGHVPDTTWTGRPEPPEWLDLSPRVNSSLGAQARHYPLGYRPTEFRFEE